MQQTACLRCSLAGIVIDADTGAEREEEAQRAARVHGAPRQAAAAWPLAARARVTDHPSDRLSWSNER